MTTSDSSCQLEALQPRCLLLERVLTQGGLVRHYADEVLERSELKPTGSDVKVRVLQRGSAPANKARKQAADAIDWFHTYGHGVFQTLYSESLSAVS